MDTCIEFDGLLSPSCMKYLISSFVKYVLYQRGQIPFQFDSLKDYANTPIAALAPGITGDLSDMKLCDAKEVHCRRRQLRENLKRARDLQRKARNDERLRRRIHAFLASYDAYDQHLSEALDSRSWPSGLQVALLLGGTPISPKEVYVLHFPSTDSGMDQHPRRLQHRRGAVQLFRTLVTSSQLLELTARQLAPTNLHVLVRTRPDGGRPLLPRPGLCLRRGTVIHIRLEHGAAALARPPPPPPPAAAVAPCCGRAAPRRLQPCCARFASEMGLTLLDASPSPRPAAAPPASSPSTVTSATSSPPPGKTASTERDAEVAEAAAVGPMWCQIPVALRGFRAPRAGRRSGDCLAAE